MQFNNKSDGKRNLFVSVCSYIYNKISASVFESVIIGFFIDLFSRDTAEKEVGIIRSPIKKSVVFKNILGMRVFLARTYERSILGRHMRRLYKTFLSLPLRTLAIFLITYGLVLAFGSSISASGMKFALSSPSFFSGVAITAVSVVIFPSRKSIYEHIQQSMFLSVFSGENHSLWNDDNISYPRGYSSAFLAGLILGVLSFALTPSKVLLFLVALLCTSAIFNYPETGVMLTVSLLPILSTAYIIYLIFVTVIAYMFKCIIGKRHFNTKDTDILILLAVAVIMCSGMFTASGISGTVHSAKLLFCLFSAILISNLVRSTRTVLKCVSMIIGSTIAVCTFNILLYIVQYTRISDELSLHFSVTDFIGVLNIFSGRNELGIFSATMVPLILSYALNTGNKKNSKYSIVLILLALNLIICGNPAAFFVSIISVLLVLAFKNKLWLLLIIPCVIFKRFISYLPMTIMNLIGMNTLNGTQIQFSENTSGMLQLISEYGLFGTGLGDENIYSSVKALTSNFTEFGSLFESGLISLGLFGVLFFVILICVYLSKPFNYVLTYDYRDEKITTVCIGLFVSCLSFIIMSAVSYTASDTRLLVLFVVCASLSVAASRSSKNDYISDFVVREHINYQ